MRAIEFLNEQQLDELNWRAPAAAAGIAGAVAGGLATHNPPPVEPVAQVMQVPTPTPAVATPLAKAPQAAAKKPTASPESVAKAKDLLSNPNAKVLYQTAVKAGITGAELAQFMAQCAHETKNFTTRREAGNTKYFMQKYDMKYNPANAEILGNTKPGDGAKYFGRGDIQLTGRYNYTQAGKALGIDLVNHPELAERADIAAKIAVYFWQNRVAPKVDDFMDTAAVTRPINRKLTGLDDRHEKFTGMHDIIAKK